MDPPALDELVFVDYSEQGVEDGGIGIENLIEETGFNPVVGHGPTPVPYKLVVVKKFRNFYDAENFIRHGK